MYKKILLMILCFLAAMACSSPSNPDNTNNGDIVNGGGSGEEVQAMEEILIYLGLK